MTADPDRRRRQSAASRKAWKNRKRAAERRAEAAAIRAALTPDGEPLPSPERGTDTDKVLSGAQISALVRRLAPGGGDA